MALEAYDEKLTPARFGLNNTGVICHFNALLQALTSNTAVIRAVLANREYMSKTATGQALHDFIWQAAPIARLAGSGLFSMSRPVEFMSSRVLQALVYDLRRRRPRTRFGGGQESASEGLVLLLDMLDDPNAPTTLIDGVPHADPNPVARLFYHRYNARVVCRDCRKVVSEQQLDSAVQVNMFGVQHMSPADPAEFGRRIAANTCDLEGYSCPSCNVKTSAMRHCSLEMVPEVLVCVFNVYGPERKANHFPEAVEFRGRGGRPVRFRQTAQVEHTGSLRSGHYTAKGLRKEGVMAFNDTSASPSRFGPSPSVYMVCYHHVANAG